MIDPLKLKICVFELCHYPARERLPIFVSDPSFERIGLAASLEDLGMPSLRHQDSVPSKNPQLCWVDSAGQGPFLVYHLKSNHATSKGSRKKSPIQFHNEVRGKLHVGIQRQNVFADNSRITNSKLPLSSVRVERALNYANI